MSLNRSSRPGSPVQTALARHGALLFLCLTVAFVAYVRIRLADVPLERDEGEYAYAGQLLLQGIPPYKLAYNMKFPGTYYAYSVILAIFGQTPRGVHLGLLAINVATIVIVLFLGRRLVGSFGGGVASATYAVMSLDRWVLGVFAHATHFVVLPALAAFLLLFRAVESRRAIDFFAAGALVGIAVLMKQHAVFFGVLAVAMAFSMKSSDGDYSRDRSGTRRAALVLAGSVVPPLVTCLVLAWEDVFPQFVFWTFQYATEYVSQTTVSFGVAMLRFAIREITQASVWLWALSAAGLATLGMAHVGSGARVFLIGLLVASCAAIVPGFFFREHYFILLLPAAALLTGSFLVYVEDVAGTVMTPIAARVCAVAILAGAVGAFVVHESDYLFSMTPDDVSRTRYGTNPFIEAVVVAESIRKDTGADDRIAVIGSEPEIYFYSNRKSATGYIYTYPLMEPQRYASSMQDEMIMEIEGARPKYVVFVTVATSWLTRPDSDDRILKWANAFTKACYDEVGAPDLRNLVSTFRRRSDAPDCVATR